MRPVLAAWVMTTCAALPSVAAPAAPPCTPDLAAYRWTHRPLLVFAPSAADPRHEAFVARALALAAELAERDVPLIHAFTRQEGGEPACTIDLEAAGRLRAALGIAAADATIVLIGKDGSEKARQPIDAPLEPILERIDGMPMRQRERRDRAGGQLGPGAPAHAP